MINDIISHPIWINFHLFVLERAQTELIYDTKSFENKLLDINNAIVPVKHHWCYWSQIPRRNHAIFLSTVQWKL